MHAAITMQQIQPNSQHAPMENKMPNGTAFVAFAASSLMWTAESNPPMVQMGDSHESIKVQPAGQVVRFSTWVKIYEAELRWSAPMGRAMMVARIKTKFMITKIVCIFPITLAMVEAIRPWQATVARKTA